MEGVSLLCGLNWSVGHTAEENTMLGVADVHVGVAVTTVGHRPSPPRSMILGRATIAIDSGIGCRRGSTVGFFNVNRNPLEISR